MKALLEEDSHTRANSQRKMAKKIRISRWAIRSMLKKGGYRPWKDQERQALNEVQMKKRRERCPELLARYFDCHDADGLPVLFTDEKLFTVEQAYNHQNDNRWTRGSPPKADSGAVSGGYSYCLVRNSPASGLIHRFLPSQRQEPTNLNYRVAKNIPAMFFGLLTPLLFELNHQHIDKLVSFLGVLVTFR
jgi:hypothetical protein